MLINKNTLMMIILEGYNYTHYSDACRNSDLPPMKRSWNEVWSYKAQFSEKTYQIWKDEQKIYKKQFIK